MNGRVVDVGAGGAGNGWLVVPFSRVNAWVCPVLMGVCAVLDVVLLGLGGFMMFAPVKAGTPLGGRIAMIVLGVLVVLTGLWMAAFVAFGVRASIKFGIRGAPALWVDERGLHWLQGYLPGVRTLPWTDVGNIAIYSLRRGDMLIVEHADAAAWRRSRLRLTRLVWWNAFRGTGAAGKFPAMMWPRGPLAMTLEELEARLLVCWKRALGVEEAAADLARTSEARNR